MSQNPCRTSASPDDPPVASAGVPRPPERRRLPGHVRVLGTIFVAIAVYIAALALLEAAGMVRVMGADAGGTHGLRLWSIWSLGGCVAHALAGYGLIRARAWGWWIAIVVVVYIVFTGVFSAGTMPTASLAVGHGVYVALLLWLTLGAKVVIQK